MKRVDWVVWWCLVWVVCGGVGCFSSSPSLPLVSPSKSGEKSNKAKGAGKGNPVAEKGIKSSKGSGFASNRKPLRKSREGWNARIEGTLDACRVSPVLRVSAITKPWSHEALRKKAFVFLDWKRPALTKKRGDALLTKFLVGPKRQRKEQAKFLIALLEQALLDELPGGRSPWLATPFWGSSGMNPAREFRKRIATRVGKSLNDDVGSDVVRWMLFREPLYPLQNVALRALSRMKGENTRLLLKQLLLYKKLNAWAVGFVLKEIQRRRWKKQDVSVIERLRLLARHHRKALRESARTLLGVWKVSAPATFSPLKALREKSIRSMVSVVEGMWVEAPKGNAVFGVLKTEVVEVKSGKRRYPRERKGWLLQETKSHWVLALAFGGRWVVPKRKTFDTESVQVATWRKLDLAKEVAWIVKERAAKNPKFKLTRGGGLSGQFGGKGAGLYEILMSTWLVKANRLDWAAQVLFPALDTLWSDTDWVRLARRKLGKLYGYQMLRAFVGKRDYQMTLAWSKRMVTCHPRSPLTRFARRFQKELPRRMDDFRSFRLPTKAEWKKMKASMKREQQLVFLLKRLRLLNVFQMGQPGGVSYKEKQFAEPCGLSENAAWGLREGKTQVVNPYSLLSGQTRMGKVRQPSSETLRREDLPLLLKALRQPSWMVLAVEFWRDFHAHRNLFTTRHLLCSLLNQAAKKKLCGFRLMNQPEAAFQKAVDALEIKAKKWMKQPPTRKATPLPKLQE